MKSALIVLTILGAASIAAAQGGHGPGTCMPRHRWEMGCGVPGPWFGQETCGGTRHGHGTVRRRGADASVSLFGARVAAHRLGGGLLMAQGGHGPNGRGSESHGLGQETCNGTRCVHDTIRERWRNGGGVHGTWFGQETCNGS